MIPDNILHRLVRSAHWSLPLALAIVLFGLTGFEGYFGQDSHAFLTFADEWKASGFDPVLARHFQWPVGYPLAGILLSYLGIPLKWALILVSLLSSVGVLWITRKIIRQLYWVDGSIWILLAATTQVYFIRGGILGLNDMPACFMVMFTWYSFFRFRKEQHIRFLLWMTLAAVAGYYILSVSIVLTAPALAGAVIMTFRKEHILNRFAAAGLWLVCLSLLVLDEHTVRLVVDTLRQWNPVHAFSMTGDEVGGEPRTVPNILYVFGNFLHIGYLSVGVFLLPWYRQIGRNLYLWVAVGLYLLLLAGLNVQNYRFLLLVHPLVLILLFPAFGALYAFMEQGRRKRVFVSGILLLNVAFFMYSFRKTYEVARNEKEIAQKILALEYKGPVYSFYVDQAFPTYGVRNETHNLYLEQIDSVSPGALVIYNPEKFDRYWGRTQVVRNWKYLCEHYELDTLQTLNDGWGIYRIR